MNAASTTLLHSGNEMPVIGIGTWQLTDHTADAIAEALSLGFRMIDTSGDYGTQPGVGEGLQASTVARENVYIVTKVEETDDAYEATRKNLDELGMAYADLVLIHRPPNQGSGKDLWKGLIRAKEEGLTKDIGVSNYSTDQIQSLIDTTGEVPSVNQIEWTPFGHDKEMLDYCEDNGIVVQAYSPLTRGERLDDPDLLQIADHYNKSPSQVMLRWNIQLGVVPIVKARKTEHMSEDIDIFDFELDEEDMAALSDMNEAYSALGKLPYYAAHS